MNPRLLIVALLAAVSGWADAPAGRWDGTIAYGALKVPFTLYFDGSGATLTGSFVNGEARVASTSGSFEGGVVRLSFDGSGTRLEAALANGGLEGTYGNAKQGMHAITASAYCTCAYEGEAGPEIMGTWEVPGADWRFEIRRTGEDTFAAVSGPGGGVGPLSGRFDGLTFTLHYFDGARAAVLQIEPRKDNGLDIAWMEPGAEVKRLEAVKK